MARPASSRTDALLAAGLALLAVAVYASTLGFDFVGFDDDAYVRHNPVVGRGLTPDLARYAFSVQIANWHPLTFYSHALDVELFGLAPAGHHAVNVALHALATALLFGLLRSATGARWRSAFAAALFAVHPLHAEVVAWVSQRKTLLCAVFGFAALWAWVAWTHTRRRTWLAASVASLGVGLLAKPMLVSVPLLALLLDAWPLGRVRDAASLARCALEKLVFVVPVAAVAAATLFAQRSMDAMAPLGLDAFLRASLPNAVLGLAWYVGKAVWPVGLAAHYPHPYLPSAGGVPPSALALVLALAVVVGASGVAWAARRRAPWLGFGWAWLVVALLPVLGLVQVGTQGVADRYAYVPLVGLFVAAAWGGDAALRALRVPRPAAAALAACVVAAFGVAAHVQASHWRSSLALYRRAVDVSPRDVAMLFNLGNAELARGDVDEAERLYRRALAIHPASSPAQLNLAELLRERGRADDRAESIALYRSVLVARPGNRRAREGLAALGETGP